jgi:hypothetical protein
VFGREALLNILACLETLLVSECSVPVATTIQLNIIFVLADGLDLATARQLPALGLVLAEKGASFKNAFVEYSTRCVDPQGYHTHQPLQSPTRSVPAPGNHAGRPKTLRRQP